MSAHSSSALTAIANCLAHAINITGLPAATIDSGSIAASLSVDLLPHLPSQTELIHQPFDGKEDDGSQNRIVFCIPPNQTTLSVDAEHACSLMCEALQIGTPRLTHWLYAAVALYHAGPRGKAFMLIPQTSLSRSAWRMGQQGFIDNKLVEAIVALPESIIMTVDDPQQPQQHRLNTVVYDTLAILSRPKSRTSPNQIAFVLPNEITRFTNGNRENHSSEMFVPYETIIENGYLLTPFRYREERPSFHNSVRLRNVATIVRGISKARLREIRQLTASSLDGLEPTPDGESPVAYLTSKDFVHGYDYCHLAHAGAYPSPSYFASRDLEANGIASFTENCVLLSRTGAPFKACRLGRESFSYQAGAFLVADNLYRIQPTPDLDADYLLAFLASTPGQQALSRIANSATTMQQISPNDLRDMLIPLPPIEQQNEVAAQYRKQLDRIADLERQRASLALERDRWFQTGE